jgi:predicted DCC family thiol-disulfide oxidoreductase YuxK
MSELKIFFDGKCVVCDAEINHYLKLDSDKNLKAIDITSPSFSANDYGLDDKEIHIHMHAIDDKGNIYTGVDSFREIWRRLPYYNKLVPLSEVDILKPAYNLGYSIFAKYIRPNLPKKKCDSDYCNY